jgi:hypothetical protein
MPLRRRLYREAVAATQEAIALYNACQNAQDQLEKRKKIVDFTVSYFYGIVIKSSCFL